MTWVYQPLNKLLYLNGKFLNQRTTGVQRVAHEYRPYLESIGASLVNPPRWLENSFLLMLWEQIVLPFITRKGLLVSLCNTGPLVKKNQIIFIHDLAFEYNPKWFSQTFCIYYRWLIPKLARRSRRIFTCSNFTKNELQNKYKIASDKIDVIHNGVSDRFRNVSNKVLDCHEVKSSLRPYVLAVGSLEPRKNLRLLLNVWAEKFGDSEFDLIICGSENKIFASQDLNFQTKNIRFTGYLEDRQLVEKYEDATVFVYPSLYEGFGLPPVEAMALGVPVLCSDAASLPEVVGDAAKLFRSGDPHDLAIKLNELMYTEKVRSELSDRGFKRVKMYSWSLSGEKLIKCIRAMAQE